MSIIERKFLSSDEYVGNASYGQGFLIVQWRTTLINDYSWIVPRPQTADKSCTCARGAVDSRNVGGLGGGKEYSFEQTIYFGPDGCNCPLLDHKVLYKEWVELEIAKKYPHGKPYPVSATVMK